MSKLTHKDMRELNARGRAAGLGLDLWPEAATMEWRCDRLTNSFNALPWEVPTSEEVKRACDVLRHKFHQGLEQEFLRQGRPTNWPPGFVPVDPHRAMSEEGMLEMQMRGMQGSLYSLAAPLPPPDSPGWVAMVLEPSPLLPRLKDLLRRISPWAR